MSGKQYVRMMSRKEKGLPEKVERKNVVKEKVEIEFTEIPPNKMKMKIIRRRNGKISNS